MESEITHDIPDCRVETGRSRPLRDVCVSYAIQPDRPDIPTVQAVCSVVAVPAQTVSEVAGPEPGTEVLLAVAILLAFVTLKFRG